MREPTTADCSQAAVADETADVGLAKGLIHTMPPLDDVTAAVAASASPPVAKPCLQGEVSGIGGDDGAERAAGDERLDTVADKTEGVVGGLKATLVLVPMAQVGLTRL